MNKTLPIHPSNIELLGPPKNGTNYSYEECLPAIDKELKKRESRWHLERVTYLNYQDVCQIIRCHFYVKWSQLDCSQFILKWVNTVITNQTRNVIRNIWTSKSSICNQCPANKGGGVCELYGETRNSDCRVYNEWSKTKKINKEHIHFADSFDTLEESQKSKLICDINSFQNYDLTKFHKLIQPLLTQYQWKVYSLIYVDGLDEIEAAKKLGFKDSISNHRNPGYKSMLKMRKIFLEKAKEVINNNDLF